MITIDIHKQSPLRRRNKSVYIADVRKALHIRMFDWRLAWFCGKPGLMLRKLPWSPIFDLTAGSGFDTVDLIEKQSETGGFVTLTESFSYIISLSKLCTCLTSGRQPRTERV